MGILLNNKVVVITGASSGIGAEIAILLAKKGAITILMARSIEKLKDVASKIEGRHDIFQLDVTSTEQVNEVMDKVISKYKKIDILINNAGFGIFDQFAKASLVDFEEMMDVNYMGTIRCTKAVIPSMLKENSGHIINVASIAGKIGTAKATGYSASKFAVIGFSNSLRHELNDTGINVSTVNPGPIDTPFFDRADPSGDYVKDIKWMMLTSEKVANHVLDVIHNKKPDKTIPFMGRVGVKLYHMFPNTFDKLMSKQMNKK